MGFKTSKQSSATSEHTGTQAEIRALFASAQLLPSVERVAVLQQALDDLVAADLPMVERFGQLERCAVIAIDTLAELVNEFHTLTLPLSEDHESRVRSVLKLSKALDNELAALEFDRKQIPAGPVLYRRIALLLEELTFSAACYHPWSKNLWVRIHQIYTRAEALNVAGYSPPKKNSDDQPLSLTESYLIAVLTAAADPYQMPYRDIQNARTLATTFLESVSVSHSARVRKAPAGNHKLLIDDRVDKPALPYRSDKDLDHHHVVVDLEDCYTILAERLEILEKDRKAKDPLFGNLQRQNIVGLYRHVLVKWGWQPVRTSPRLSMDVKLDLILGYRNILTEFQSDTQHKDPFPPLRQFKPTEIEQDAAPAKDTREPVAIVAAVSVDVSETGIGLRVSQVNDAALRVGEVVAYRPSEMDQDWRLGTIRWVKSVSRGVAEVGVLKLPGHLHVGTLLGVERMRSVGRSETKRELNGEENLPVLISTNASGDNPGSAHILLHSSMGDTNLVHWVSFDATDRMVLSMKKFLTTRYVVAYGCHLSEPRKKPRMVNARMTEKDFTFS